MKKLLAILLAAFMLVGSMPLSLLAGDFNPDPDGDGEYFVLKAGDATITETDTTVDVTINITHNTGVYAMKYYVIYDKELTLVSNDNVTKGDAFDDFLVSDVGSKDMTDDWMSVEDIDWDWMLENYYYDHGWTLEDPDDVLITTVYSECVNWYDSSTDTGTICTFTFQIAPENTKDEFTVQILPVYGNFIRDDPDHPLADPDGIVEIFDPVGVPGIVTIEKSEPACEHEYFYPCDPVCMKCYEITNPDAAHSVIHVEAVAPTCFEEGNVEYWYCEFCGASWLDSDCTLITNIMSVKLPAAHTFANPCDTYCVVCEEDVRDPAHTLTYVARVEPVDCQTPGNIEHWYCEVCEGYFADENGINQYNPWYIPVTTDCVRPEGIADCETFVCELCGSENYGIVDHDLGENYACQGGECINCGEEVEGFGCANYDTPACMDGVCHYCGGFVAGLGHENGAWAPCLEGECSYGCGLEYPATAEHEDDDGDGYCNVCWNHINHSFDNGFDPCYGGECSICWTYVEGSHSYAYDCDKICSVCGEEREAEHNIIHVDAENHTCFEEGNVEYWFCDICGYAWLDEECTIVTNLLSVNTPAAHEELTHVEAVAPTCFENGNIEYWYCEACGYAWLDAEGIRSTNLNAVILPMQHAELTHVEAVAPTCFENGNIEYWYCEACGYAWLDAEGIRSTNLNAVVLPMQHAELTHVEAVDPTCYENGNIEYWYCEACGYAWLDAEGIRSTNLNAVVLPMAHGEIIHIEAKAPTCFENGNIEYWYCVECGQAWLDAECTLNTNILAVVLPNPGHFAEIVHVEAKEPTCTEEGNIEYWYCPECGYAWLDAEGTLNTNLKAVVLPAKGHTPGEPAVELGYLVTKCVDCDEILASEPIIPNTELGIEPGWSADAGLCEIINVSRTINIVSKMDALTVDFRVLFPVESTDYYYVTSESENVTIKQIVYGEVVYVDGTNEDATLWKYFEVNAENGYNQTFEIIVTDKITGEEYVYTVNVEFAHGPACTGIEPGWSADASLTGFDAENDHVINVVSMPGMDEVDFRLMNMATYSYAEIYSGDANVVQWVVSENAYVNVTDDMPEAEDHTQWKYFKSFREDGAEQSYEIIVYFVDGSSEIFTVNVTFVD